MQVNALDLTSLRQLDIKARLKKKKKKKENITNSAVTGSYLPAKLLFHHLRQFILLNVMAIVPALWRGRLRIVG